MAGDHFHDHLRSGQILPWEPEAHDQNVTVIDITLRTAAAYADAGWTTVLEGIFTSRFLDAIRRELRDHETHYVVLDAPLDLCVSRFVQRETSDERVHVVEKMHAEFDDARRDDHHVIDSSGDPAVTAAEVTAAVASGRMLI